MKFGFIFVNYNNSEYTEEVTASLHRIGHNADFRIVVVDNQSDSKNREDLKRIASKYTNVDLILNDANVGYFRGLNIGIRHLRFHYKDIEIIVIGNNDLIFPSGFFDALYNALPMLQTHAVISPDVITLDGVHQNPHVIKKISKFREVIYDLYYLNYYFALIINRIAKMTEKVTNRKDEEQYQVAQKIYQGYGCCYILCPLFFLHFEELWAPTLLMGEEFFLSLQLKNKGLHLYYDPAISVIHQCNGAVAKVPPKQIWEFSREAHKVYRKYVKIWR